MTDGNTGPGASIGDTPLFVSSVRERMAGDRKRTMVTISARPGTPRPTTPRRRPCPGTGREPGRRPRPRLPEAPPRPPPPRGSHRAGRVKQRPVRTSTRWPAALTLAALGLAVAIPFLVQAILLLTGHHGADSRGDRPAAALVTTRPTVTPSATPTVTPTAAPVVAPAALLTWVGAELDHTSIVVADPDTVTALRRAGFGSAVGYADAPQQVSGTVYVVDVPPGVSSSGRTALLSRSLPVAAFPTTAGDATVRQLVASTADAQSASRGNAKSRLEGGRKLRKNKALRSDAATSHDLSHGLIDLRVQKALDTLAGKSRTGSPLRVTRPERDPAEQRAGLPIRSIVLDGGSRTRAALRALPARYRPARIDRLSKDAVRAVWSLTLPTASGVDHATPRPTGSG